MKAFRQAVKTHYFSLAISVFNGFIILSEFYLIVGMHVFNM